MFLSPNTCPVCEQPTPDSAERCPVCRSLVSMSTLWPIFERAAVNEQAVQAGIERARRETKADPNDGQARYALGLAYLNLGLSEQGLQELRHAAELLPEQHRIRYEVACVEAAAGNSAVAAQHLNQALQQSPGERSYRYLQEFLLAAAPIERHDVREGVQHWIAAYRLDPEAAPAREALQGFVADNNARLHQPVARALRGLTPAQEEALNLLNGRVKATTQRLPGTPSTPRPLGKTSMRLLRKYAPARATALEQMYTERVAAHATAVEQYEARRQTLALQNDTAVAAHEKRLHQIRADLPLLAELCAMALQFEIGQQREAERRRQEQEARQQATVARRAETASRAVAAPPPVKERQVYQTNATYVQGLPVGKKGDVIHMVVTNQRIVLTRSALLDKWAHQIPLTALTEAVDDTVKGFMSKEPRLRLSYRDSQGMIAHALFTGLKVDVCLKSILQARMGR